MRRRPRLILVALLAVIALVATGCASGATDPANDITDSAATLRAHGSTGGDPSEWWFEYGTTTSYGSSTPHKSVGADPAQQSVVARVKDLAPDTLYHFRACASNQRGSGCARTRRSARGRPTCCRGFRTRSPSTGSPQPTVVRFSPDGRVFVAEKSGLIKVFDGLGDTTPTTFADLRTEVHNYWDRGLLGMALDPDFPAEAVRLRAVHPRRADRRHGADLGAAGPDRRRRPARPATAASSAAGCRGSKPTATR